MFFGFIVIMRYIGYRETMTLAEKGLVHPARNGGGKGALVWGIVITSLGLALCVGLWPLGPAVGVHNFPLGMGPWMLLGIIPTFFGLGLVLVYVLTRESKKANGAVGGEAPKTDEMAPKNE